MVENLQVFRNRTQKPLDTTREKSRIQFDGSGEGFSAVLTLLIVLIAATEFANVDYRRDLNAGFLAVKLVSELMAKAPQERSDQHFSDVFGYGGRHLSLQQSHQL